MALRAALMDFAPLRLCVNQSYLAEPGAFDRTKDAQTLSSGNKAATTIRNDLANERPFKR
jgi:hypothetical protein